MLRKLPKIPNLKSRLNPESPSIHPSLTLRKLQRASHTEGGEGLGYCSECGCSYTGIEPLAKGLPCYSTYYGCGKDSVCGWLELEWMLEWSGPPTSKAGKIL